MDSSVTATHLAVLLRILHNDVERARQLLASGDREATATILETASLRCADLTELVEILAGCEEVPS